jgi:hypothetical protein
VSPLINCKAKLEMAKKELSKLAELEAENRELKRPVFRPWISAVVRPTFEAYSPQSECPITRNTRDGR